MSKNIPEKQRLQRLLPQLVEKYKTAFKYGSLEARFQMGCHYNVYRILFSGRITPQIMGFRRAAALGHLKAQDYLERDYWIH